MSINENMQRLRKAAKLSQGELAQKMTDRGRPWHQNTVSRIELGKQDLDSLGDVIVLQEILGPELIEGTPLAQGMDITARRSFYSQAKTELDVVKDRLKDLQKAADELSTLVESIKPAPVDKDLRDRERSKIQLARELFEESMRQAGLYLDGEDPARSPQREDGATQARRVLKDFEAEVERQGYTFTPAGDVANPAEGTGDDAEAYLQEGARRGVDQEA